MARFIKYIQYTAVFLSLACVHGPKQEKKSSLNYVNGEHYHSDVRVGPIPLSIKRQIVNTKVSGKIIDKTSEFFSKPLANTEFSLMKQDKEILIFSSDSKGTFYFSADLPSGYYHIKCHDSNYEVVTKIKIFTYEHHNLTITTKKIENG